MLVSKIEDRKAALAAHIKATEEAIAALESEHAAVTESVQDYALLLSPVRPAPYDVLSVILMCYLDTMDGPLFALYGRAQKHISVTLSQVSQEWWRLALGMPALWARIHVVITCVHTVWGLEDGNQEWCRKLEYRLEEVVLWTQRASRSPIKIKIDTSPNELPELNDAYSVQAQAQHKLLVDAICASSSR